MNDSPSQTDHTPSAPASPTSAEGEEQQAAPAAPREEAAAPPEQPVGDTPPPAQAAPETDAPAEATQPAEPEPPAEAAPTESAAPSTDQPAASAPAPTEDAAARPPQATAATHPVRTGTIAAIRGQEVAVEFAGKRAGVCPLSTFAKPPKVGQRVGFVIEREPEDETKAVHILRPAVGAASADRTPLKQLNVGDVHDAQVIGMNTGGLEVKVAGHRAFLPASQLDRKRVDNFLPYLNKSLRCRITEVNRRKRRIVVSRRSVLDDEDRAELGKQMAHIEVGEVRECRVRNIEKFGVFLQWEPGIDGLVRLSDIAHARVDDPKAFVKVGDTVKAKVLRVEPEKARLTLGIRQATPNPWKSVEERYPEGSQQTGKVTRTTDFGAFVELEPGIEGLIHISQLAPQRVERVEQVVKEGQEVTAKVVQSDGKRKRIGLSIRALTEPEAAPKGKASRDDLKKYVKKSEKQAHATQSLGSLMEKFGDSDGLKGGIG